MKGQLRMYEDFTNRFRRDITLKMRLDPCAFMDGKIKFLDKSDFEIEDDSNKAKLSDDEKFYGDYKKLKPIIDRYHQCHIQDSLDTFIINALEDDKEDNFIALVSTLSILKQKKEEDKNKEKERNEQIGDIARKLCKQISDHLKEDSKNKYFTKPLAQKDGTEKKFGYAQLFSKEFFVSELSNFAEETGVLSSDEISHVNSVKEQATRMTQYCDKLFTSRKNVYGMKKNSVAYRCIHENLFRFLGIYKKANRIINVLGEESLSSSLANEIQDILPEFRGIGEVFTPEKYCYYLSQKGIDKFNTLIASLNTIINQYNQSLSHKERKENKLYRLKSLHKQILSDKEAVIDVIANDQELEDKIQSVVSLLNELGLIEGANDNSVKNLLDSLSIYNKEHIYLNSNNLYPISAVLLGDGLKLKNMIDWKKDNTPKRKTVSIHEINQYIRESLKCEIDVCSYFYGLKTKDPLNEKIVDIYDLIQERFKKYAECNSETFKGDRKTAFKRLMDVVVALSRTMKSLACTENMDESDDAFYEEYDIIMEKLKKIDHAYNLIRNYVLQTNDRNDSFPLYFGEDAKEFLRGFTTVKNHGTKHKGYLFRKPVGEIGGQVYYDYYLGISNSASLFKERNATERLENDSDLQRLIYYQTNEQTFRGNQFESANKEDGKACKIVEYEEKLYNSILDVVNNDTTLKELIYKGDELVDGANTTKGIIKIIGEDHLRCIMSIPGVAKIDKTLSKKLIKTAKSVARIKELKNFKAAKGLYSWEIYDELMKLVSTCRAKSYEWVDKTKLENALKGEKSSKMYLFRITNKDLNYFEPNQTAIGKIQRTDEPIRKSHGRENLHTIFFRSMMNENEFVFDLGAGKIMYRRASLEKEETHKVDESTKINRLKNKNKLNKKEYSEFRYSLYKDKRFTRDQMTLHLSMAQNYCVPAKSDLNQLNEDVRKYLKDTKEKVNIIGIDRGERNLLYVTLMKPDGTIIRQKSLNIITDDTYHLSTDYHRLLKEKEDKIKQQKADWEDIDKISNLKEGYLSLAVHEIAKMAVDNKAIIVMEKLSEGFKSARQKYMSNVYQLFERMLVRKLSFYTDKTKAKNEPGGVLNALQLTAPDSVDLDKNDDKVVQNGIIFFVPAWMTSKIDPVTGFANLFTFGGIKTIKEAKEMLSKFSAIGYDKRRKEFVFSFAYRDFGVAIDSVNKWAIGTHGSRIVFCRNENGYPSRKHIDLTDEFIQFFQKYEVEKSEDMRETLLNYNVADHPTISDELKESGNPVFFEELFRNIRYIVQLRNSDPDAKDEKNKDYIISPVIKADGKYYISSKYINAESPEKQEKAKLPVDSDANGAYNIARKGIMVIQQIKEEKKALKIGEKEWLAFAQKSYKDSLS